MESKRCYICLQTKSFSDFLNNRSKKDGKRGECRDCGREIKRGRKRKPTTTEQNRRAKKSPGAVRYRKSEKSRAGERRRKQRRYHSDPEYRAKVREKLQRSKTPEKNYARRRLGKALKKGKIQKQPCACGNTRVHGHHEDYSKPLDVIWLCASCHQKLHYQKRTAAAFDLDAY